MSTSDPTDDDDRLDALLRAATAAREPSDPPEPQPEDTVDDGLIRAWRAGALDDEATAALEAQLAESPTARAVAAASAEPVPDALLTWAEQQAPRAAPAPTRARRGLALAAVARGRTRGGLALAAVALIAVGATLLLRPGQPDYHYVTSPLAGGAATVRSEAAVGGVPVFRAQGILQVTLRPEVAGEAPPVAAFVARPDGVLRAVPISVETPPGGAVVIQAPAGRIFGSEHGEWRFYVALGEPGRAEGRIFAEARAGSESLWFEYPLVFEPVTDDGGDP